MAILAMFGMSALTFSSSAAVPGSAYSFDPVRQAATPARPLNRPSAVSIDDPGLAYGFPSHNTFGYTTTYDNFVRLDSRPVWDVGGGSPPSSGELRVDVELGGFNRMHSVTDIADYWMKVDFTATVFTWANGDGRYCPAGGLSSFVLPPQQLALILQQCQGYYGYPSAHDDDPCPVGPFPLFDVFVQPGGSPAPPTFLRTVMGGNMQNCAPGAPSESHPFQVLPAGNPNYPSDPPELFRIPKGLLEQYVDEGKVTKVCCYATIVFRPHDLVLPAYAAAHDKSQDGVKLEVRSVQVQLVAPPMVISHGWTPDVTPPTDPSNGQLTFVPVDPNDNPILWQSHLRANLTYEMTQHFGQDPWDWARAKGREPVLLNEYDRKKDLRESALLLGSRVTDLMSDMHWTGKVWMHGHSLGGLVSRYYIEDMGGAAHVEKFSQDASPNLGSFEGNIYTWLHHLRYAEQNGTTLGRYIVGNSHPATLNPGTWWFSVGVLRCWVHVGLYAWKPWWDPAVGAYTQSCSDDYQWSGNTPGNGFGQQRVADFELKPVLDNPVLYPMDLHFFALAALPGSLPPYYEHATKPNLVQPPGTLPPYFTVRTSWNNLEFDQAVSFRSATLNGAIQSRTINSVHEHTPDHPHAARFLARYYGNLDLDSGYPTFCRPGVPFGPTPPVHNFGDDVTLGGGLTTNDQPDLHFEEYGGRAPSCPPGFPACAGANEGDERDPASSTGADRFDVFVDGQAFARFVVHSALEEPPLQFDAVSPSGQTFTATNDETGWTRTQTIEVHTPQAGKWTVHVGPAPAQQYYLGMYWDSPLELTAAMSLASYPAHTPVTFTATLKGPGVGVIQANVFAEVPDQTNGGELHIPMQTAGFPANETWSGTWLPPTTLGQNGKLLLCASTYHASVTATGTRGGTTGLPTGVLDFTRSVELEVHLEGDPTDAAACNPPPAPASSGTPTVLVAVPLVVGIIGGGFGGGLLVGRRRRG